MLDTIALVGSALAAIASVVAAQMSRSARARRLREADKQSKNVTVKVDGRTYKVKAPPEEIERFITRV